MYFYVHVKSRDMLSIFHLWSYIAWLNLSFVVTKWRWILTAVDLSCHNSSHYNFYRMEILLWGNMHMYAQFNKLTRSFIVCPLIDDEMMSWITLSKCCGSMSRRQVDPQQTCFSQITKARKSQILPVKMKKTQENLWLLKTSGMVLSILFSPGDWSLMTSNGVSLAKYLTGWVTSLPCIN